MYPFGYQPPPYYPPMGGYSPSSSDDALKIAKAMIKEGRRIKRDLEATKKPEEKRNKSTWERLDTLHVFLGMMTAAPIIGLLWRQIFLLLLK